MKVCTINVPERYLDCIAVLVEMGYFPSRSEAVRQALTQFVSKEVSNFEQLSKENFKDIKQEQLEFFFKSMKEL